MSSETQPTVITLDTRNSVQILLKFVEVAQKAGAFLLPESDILKRCKDVLLSGAQDQEINIPQARQLLIQAINKGQSKGSYSLDDASILHKVCQFLQANLTVEDTPTQVSSDTDDLSALSEPVPLKTPRVI